MLNAKKFVSTFMACTIACSVVYSSGAGFIPAAVASVIVDKPVPSVPAGRYEQSVNVTFTSTTSGAEVYYTLDGTLPDETSLKYTGTPILITESTNISVIALKDGVWSKAGTYGYIIKTSEKPLLKFAAMSDLHIGTNTPADKLSTKARYTSNFDVMSSIFKPDAIVIGGDLINDNFDGKGRDHAFVREVFQEQMARKGWEDMPVQIAIGNHDASVAEVKAGYPNEWFTSQSNGYYEKTIKDYSFFFLNANNYNGDTNQRNWLKGRLAALTSDPANLNKPIFITLHHPVKNTVMDGAQSANENLYADLKDFPQVIVLSGHSHLNINDDRSIYQKDFTAINLGSMSYVETESGYGAVTNEGLMANRNEFPVNQSEFIEVYEDRIEIERVEYNGDPGSIINGGKWEGIGREGAGTPPPYSSAGALAGKKWVVKLQGNSNAEIKSNFTYTTSNRNKTAPQFPANPEIKVLPGVSNVPVLSFRQAKDDQSMHHYEIKLLNQRTAETVKSFNVLSDYYFSPIPNKMNIPMADLDPATSYMINVTAVDVYGNKSTPVQTAYRTGGTAPGLTPIDPSTMWNGLVSDMKFEGNLDEDAPSVTGKAAQSGDVTFVTGKSGQAVEIAAGNANYVDMGDRSDLKFGNGNFTISFWHMGDLAGDQTVLANKNWNSGGNPGWYVGPATTKYMTLNMAAGGNRIDYSAQNVGIEWHYFTLSVDRTNKTASTYVDGVLKATKDISVLGTASLDTSFNIILGADGNKGNGGAEVTLDDLKIWKRALTATEAKALSDSYKEETTENLYNFNQLTSKIQEAEQFAAQIAGTTGLSLPVQVQNELTAQIAAAKSLAADSGATIIDQAYLDLIWALKAAQGAVVYTFLPKTNFSLQAYSSYAENDNDEAKNILDGQETTIWHSKYQAPADPFPHWVIIDMKNTNKISGIQRKSRTDQSYMAFPKTFELYASDHLADLNDPAFLGNAANKAAGTFGKTWTGMVYKDYVSLDKTLQGRYVKFVVTGTYDPNAIYTSMSEIDFTGEKAFSGDVALTELKVNGAAISGFTPEKLGYAIVVPYETTVATVSYSKADPAATVAVSGGENLVVGDNPVTVTVTAQDGTSKSIYTIVITRQPQPLSSDSSLIDLSVNGTVVSGFAGDKFDYAMSVPYETTVTNVTYTKANSAATVVVSGGQNLIVGDNPVTVKVTSQDGTSESTYTLVVTRQSQSASSNATLRDLQVNGVTVSGFAPDKLNYSMDVPYRSTVATVTYSVYHAAATAAVTGSSSLNVGSNVITVKVTAQDGTFKQYGIAINRSSNLESDPGPSNPSEPSTTPDKPKLPEDAVTIKDNDLKDDQSTVSVELPEGKNRLIIRVEQAEQFNGRTLQVQAPNVKLTVPWDLLKSASNLLPTPDDKAEVTVKIEPIAAAQAERTLQEASRKDNANYKLGGQMVDLSIFATNADGKQFALAKLEKPVTMTFPIPAGMNPKLAGIYEIKKDGSLVYLGGKRVNGNTAIEVGTDRLGQYAVLSLEKNYNDVTDKHWAFATIRELSAQHIVNGATDATFAPGKDISRAEFAALLARTLGLSSADTSPFGDVTAKDWYAKEAAAAYKAGIIAGNEQQAFEPNRSITREEMAVMLVRAYEHRTGSKLEASSAASSDASDISDWALPFVNSALKAKLLSGRQEGLFVPDEHTTRAEAAQAIYNLLK
ncbi:cadherin-like beta sandwich domain-containing protein [Paenibacillus sp. HWE-109]|uniref:cadherin-like beta sandwich domain-containing protein n=1 Tax=Paenibacillus sp. HWE-109 TaxID=1306526 RepID=UPI001EDD585C|nr:cadherin-like beta sandwich domain-containing protein [Paenibacillus sp. HWE-109]UKS24086.1 cadherin-like beta sandwich domain-containing protein [Paenibacillus sp. HWE-109]